MSNEDRRIDSLLRGLAPPAAPSGLRDQVLPPALAALQQDPPPDLWSRLWSSRPLRLAWAGSFTALVLCHLGLTVPRVAPADRQPLPRAMTAGTIHLEEELAELTRLPRLRTDARSLGSLLPASAGEKRNSMETRPTGNGADEPTEEDSA
jgi:hypothetical protein